MEEIPQKRLIFLVNYERFLLTLFDAKIGEYVGLVVRETYGKGGASTLTSEV